MAKSKAPVAHIEQPTPQAAAPRAAVAPQTPEPAAPQERHEAPQAHQAAATGDAPVQGRAKTSVHVDAAPAQPAPHAAATPAPATTPAAAAPAPARLSGWLARVFPGHEHAALGGACGLAVAALFFVMGFWKTLLVCLLVLVGVAAGQYLDGDPKIVNSLRGLIRWLGAPDEEHGGN